MEQAMVTTYTSLLNKERTKMTIERANEIEKIMTENYNRACALLEKGVAEKHYSFTQTGIIILDLGGKYCGYIGPQDKAVEVTCENQVCAYGNISEDLLKVEGTRHNREWAVQAW